MEELPMDNKLSILRKSFNESDNHGNKRSKRWIGAVLGIANTVLGVASGIATIVQAVQSIDANKELARNFERVFNGIYKNYNAIEETYNAVQNGVKRIDRNFIVLKNLSKMMAETLSSVEKVRYEMKEGFNEVLKSIKNSRIEPIISKLSNHFQYFENEKERITSLPQNEYITKLEEHDGLLLQLRSSRTPKGDTLHTLLYDIINQNYAIPETKEDNVAFGALFALHYGTQTYISIMFFLLEQYSYLADYYYENGDLEKYNEYFNLIESNFQDYKYSLIGGSERSSSTSSTPLIDRVINVLKTVKNLSFVRNEMENIDEILSQKIESLYEAKSQIKEMKLPIITDVPAKLITKPNFEKSQINTPLGKWKNGAKVRYAIQFKNKDVYSVVGAWSNPTTVTEKANPVVRIPVDSHRRTRLVFRKFNNDKPELVAVLENKYQTEFRDINRDLYNAVSELNENIAMNETAILINNGADFNTTCEKGRQPIHSAAQSGNTKIPLKFLADGNIIDINVKDNDGYAPIHFAAEGGYDDFIELLMEHDVNVNTKTYLEELTALHIAAYKGYASAVQSLIENCKTNNNARDKEGFAPLHSGVFGGLPVIQTLMSNKRTEISPKSKSGLTPLHLAAINNYPDIAEALLSNDETDINAKCDGDITPLHFAMISGNLEMTKFLISQNGIDVNAKAINDWTPLHFGIYGENEDAVFELLTVNTVDLNASAEGNITPLHTSAMAGEGGILLELIERKVPLNARTSKGLTALHLAAMFGRKEALSALIEKEFKVNIKDNSGCTPLHLASNYGHLNVVKSLIKNGADVNARNQNYETPLAYAAKNGHLDIVKYLIENDANINARDSSNATPLHWAAQNNQLDIIKYLIEKKVDLNLRNKDGFSPLYLAALNDNSDIVKVLLENKASTYNGQEKHSNFLVFSAANGKTNVVNYLLKSIYDDEKDLFTALHWASKNCQLDVVKNLIENGVEFLNTTHILFAAESGCLDLVKYFLDKGVDIDIMNADDSTALHFATQMGHTHVVEELINRGANLTLENKWNSKPLDYANLLDHNDLQNLLKSKTPSNSRRRRRREIKETDNQQNDNKYHYMPEGNYKNLFQSNKTFLLEENTPTINNTQSKIEPINAPDWMKLSSSNIMTAKNMKNTETFQNLAPQNVDVNGTLLLADVFLRKLTGTQYASTRSQAPSLLESRGYALNITKEFQRLLKNSAQKSGLLKNEYKFDSFELYKAIEEKIVKENSSKIVELLYSIAKDVSKNNDKLWNTLQNGIDKILEKNLIK